MPWVIKGLLLAAKSRRGRRLMGAALLGAFRLSRSAEARKVYGKTWKVARETSARVGSAAANAREAVRR